MAWERIEMRTRTKVAIFENNASTAYMSGGSRDPHDTGRGSNYPDEGGEGDPIRKGIHELRGGNTRIGFGEEAGAGELYANRANPYGDESSPPDKSKYRAPAVYPGSPPKPRGHEDYDE